MRTLIAASLALALTAGCGGSPTSPGPVAGVPPDTSSVFTGVWQLEYRLDECAGERHCVLLKGQTYPFSLRLVKSGAGYDGIVTVAGENVDVTGTIGPDGSLALTGVRRAMFASDYQTEIKRLLLRYEDGRLTGSLEYTVTGTPSPWLFGTSRRFGQILTATRHGRISPVDAAILGGTWTGRLAVRDCSSVGWPACYPHEADELWPIELTFSQAGSGVTGSVRISGSTQIAVAGHASGSTITIHGSTTAPNYAFDAVSTLRHSTLTRDIVGRLKGTIAFDIKWIPKLPDLWSYKETDFRAAELISVALKPT